MTAAAKSVAESEEEGEDRKAVTDEPHQKTRLKNKKVQGVLMKKLEGALIRR